MAVVARSAIARHRESGAVAVEFALVLPLLVMLLLGVITAGIALSESIGLTNAVREGSRFAATTPYPPASGNWADDVIARTRATQFDDPGSESKICVDLYKQGASPALLQSKCAGGAGITESPGAFSAPSGTASGTCVVRLWAARTFTINALLVKWDRVMTRNSIAIYERTPCGS
jgi:hypothetical protein